MTFLRGGPNFTWSTAKTKLSQKTKETRKHCHQRRFLKKKTKNGGFEMLFGDYLSNTGLEIDLSLQLPI